MLMLVLVGLNSFIVDGLKVVAPSVSFKVLSFENDYVEVVGWKGYEVVCNG